ncbi:MAG: CesT family type III secretion system chaperone [Burkholderiaceae bacterium]|jgi:hypothetical protein|nr:CesT family type III secretion system chaperone [Polynucleobacter sp.]MCF8189108.1 CesT family type III secretion system chaperone [Sulfuritalea sp.]
MWKQRQRSLINDLCIIAGIPDSVDLLLETGTFSCQDIPVTILPGSTDNSLAIYVQLGQPEPTQIVSIYRRLLELNLLITHKHGEHLAIDPESGAAVYGYELAFSNAEQLWISLQRATAQAIKWRSTFFLLEELSELQS